LDQLADATIVICNKFQLREDVLAKLPKLKLIAVAATGVDNIDLDFCRSHGIAVCNSRGYATSSLPEHALMLMLALRRSLISYREDVRAGRWANAGQFCLLDHPISDLSGSSLGIIGYGKLGQAMANLGRAIGMTVLVAEHKHATILREGRTDFWDVLRRSDVVSLHCPLTEETKNLIGVEELRLLKPDAILINTARGALIDDYALIQALKNRSIVGAGIDVLREEPPVSRSVLLETELPNLIVTPHHAWASKQAMRRLADQVIDNLEAFIRGEPKNFVT
jgi:glycerate dehydrogenase